MEVTADQSLEWYQDKRLYVARGHARAVRGDLVVDADLLTAHEQAATSRKPPPECRIKIRAETTPGVRQ